MVTADAFKLPQVRYSAVVIYPADRELENKIKKVAKYLNIEI